MSSPRSRRGTPAESRRRRRISQPRRMAGHRTPPNLYSAHTAEQCNTHSQQYLDTYTPARSARRRASSPSPPTVVTATRPAIPADSAA